MMIRDSGLLCLGHLVHDRTSDRLNLKFHLARHYRACRVCRVDRSGIWTYYSCIEIL